MIVFQLVIGFIVICLQCEAFTRKSLMYSAFSVFGEEVKAKNGKSLSARVHALALPFAKFQSMMTTFEHQAFVRKMTHSKIGRQGVDTKGREVGRMVRADVQIATAVAIHEETGFDPQRVGAVGEAQRHSAGIGDRRGGGDDRRAQLDEVELHCPVDALRGDIGMVEAHQLPLPVKRSVARQFVAGGGEQEGEERDEEGAKGTKAKRVHL